MPAKMKAVRIHELGSPEVLKYEDADVPKLNPDDVLIKVKYASVNPFDWKVRSGIAKMDLKFPAILGIDAAGIVEQVGANVKNFKVGDAVYCAADFMRGGSYAEYVAVVESKVAHVPKTLSIKEAAGVPVAGCTAWNGLFAEGRLKKGEKVLITGASGGVGSFAVQLAKQAGAYVIGTTSTQNIDLVKLLGADEVIDYTKEDFSQKAKDVDLVFDTVGGETFANAYKIVKKGGRLITTAGMPDQALAQKYGITAKNFFSMNNGEMLAKLAKLIDSGHIKVLIEKEFPLSATKEAHVLSESRKAKGKIVLKVSA